MKEKHIVKETKCTKLNKPCSGCPFARKNTQKGAEPGGSKVGVYFGQAFGPFWLPCHMDKNYADKESDPKRVNQCAGAAIFRANMGYDKRMPEQILKLPANHELVFSNPAEMAAHYTKMPMAPLAEALTEETIYQLFLTELSKVQ